MAGGESGKGLYDHLYRRFFEQRDSHDGYSFQQAPGGSAPTAGGDVRREAALVDL